MHNFQKIVAIFFQTEVSNIHIDLVADTGAGFGRGGGGGGGKAQRAEYWRRNSRISLKSPFNFFPKVKPVFQQPY